MRHKMQGGKGAAVHGAKEPRAAGLRGERGRGESVSEETTRGLRVERHQRRERRTSLGGLYRARYLDARPLAASHDLTRYRSSHNAGEMASPRQPRQSCNLSRDRAGAARGRAQDWER